MEWIAEFSSRADSTFCLSLFKIVRSVVAHRVYVRNLQGKSFPRDISDELVCWKPDHQDNSNPLNMDRQVLHFPLLLK